MKCPVISRKTPLFMCLFHILCIGVLVWSSVQLQEVSVCSISFFTLFSLVLVTYLLASLKDPGFLDSSKVEQARVEKSVELQVKSKSKQNCSDNSFVSVGESNRNLENQDEIQVTETRFCVVCAIEQPIRAKHCKYCGRCVALHDHHCPWLGECVGEKNRFYFFWYLVLELALLVWSLFFLVLNLTATNSLSTWLFANAIQLTLGAIIAFFACMVGCLLAFHFYMALNNITTWELLSWQKIHYLKAWPYSLGSPFSEGCKRNLYQYCCEKLQNPFKKWTLPIQKV